MKKITLFCLLLLFLIGVNARADLVHRVSRGENLHSISNQYGVMKEEIISLNNLRFPENIYNKQVLIIPERVQPATYRVKSGDSLYSIARDFGVPLWALIQFNGLDQARPLYPRQPISIPRIPQVEQEYTIKKGDTLAGIAKNFKVNLFQLRLLNSLTPGTADSELKPGQKLKLPPTIPDDPPRSNKPDFTEDFSDTLYLRGSTNNNKIALTFDDGPDSIYTPLILDILREHNLQATFFLVGDRVARYPELVSRMIREGHIVANHSRSHAYLPSLTQDQLSQEIEATEDVIRNITSLKTGLFRPPYGALSEAVLSTLHDKQYRVIFWNVDSRDWNLQDVDQILINTIPDVTRGSIILFHSAGGQNHDLSATVRVLPELITTLNMNGFEFVNLDKLLEIPPYKQES